MLKNVGPGEATERPTEGVMEDRSPRPAGDNRLPGRTPGAPVLDDPFAPGETKPTESVRSRPPEVAKAAVERNPYRLFRFIDFNVESNKQYVYRVQLALQNPNRGLKPALLASPDLAEKKWLETKWSTPSPVIAVSQDWRIALVSVKPPPKNGGEPQGEVRLTVWKRDRGLEFARVFSFGRGQVLTYLEQPATAENVAPEGPAGVERKKISANVDFATDATAIDLRGGEKISRRGRTTALMKAGELLLLNPDGTLVVHNEVDDAPAERDTAPPAEARAGTDQPAGVGGPPRGGLDTLAR